MENHEVQYTIVEYDNSIPFHSRVQNALDNLLHEEVRFSFRVCIGHPVELVIENPRQEFLFNLRGGPQVWAKLKEDFWYEETSKALEEFLRSVGTKHGSRI